jgi:uncharacterized protein YoxC
MKVSMSDIKKHRYLTILLLICFSLTGGCRQQTTNETLKDKNISSGNDQRGYLHSDGDGVMFLQWTNINNKLNGQMNVFYRKGGRGQSTETSSHSFEGVSDGKNISLNFTGSQWTVGLGGKTWTGTISGDELTLVIPLRSGSLAPVRFSAGTVEQYNQTVLGVKQSVEAENRRTQERQAVADAKERIRASLNRLAGHTGYLRTEVKFDDILESYAKALTKTQSDFKKVQDKAARKSSNQYQLDQVRYALDNVRYDVEQIGYHSNSLGYRVNTANEAIRVTKGAISSLREAWDELQRAVSTSTTETFSADYTESDILQPIREAEKEIARVSNTLQRASQQAGTIEIQSKELYRKAELESLKSKAQ